MRSSWLSWWWRSVNEILPRALPRAALAVRVAARGVRGVSVKRLMRSAVVLMLLIASSSAAALGLGQIKLMSKLGEPLLAEIPIVSSDPTELENLHAGLASPETFARIGLQLPEGVVANLQFFPALDNAGRPVIRVTSELPIQEPLLTFLVEVDWGQGRLVREYSTLLDAPRTVAASSQPSIQAPRQAPSNTIVREAVTPGAESIARENEGDDGALVADNASEADPIEVPAPQLAPLASAPSRYGAVQRGERLSNIATGLEMEGNLEQRMIALLQANPQAFINGNIHLLKQGAVLRIPDAQEVAAIAASQAAAQVREQTRAWRAASQTVPQPQVAASAAENAQGATVAAVAAAMPGADDARLEIVPPGASDATRAGTQSGISAGGEGDMVRQELQVTKETLAARDAELAELKSRIDTLEQLQTDQQTLLSMKDSELASAQQQLAQTRSAEPADAGSAMPWIFGGTALVLVLIGGWWLRRRAGVKPRFRAPVATAGDSVNLVSGFPAGAQAPAQDVDSSVLNPQAIHPSPNVSGEAAAGASTAVPPAIPVPDAASLELAQPAVPAWHAGSDKPRLNRTVPPVAPEGSPAAANSPLAVSEAVLGDSEAPGMERLELARAYLDLGDHDSARQLLGELEVSGGLEARQQATRLLRELG